MPLSDHHNSNQFWRRNIKNYNLCTLNKALLCPNACPPAPNDHFAVFLVTNCHASGPIIRPPPSRKVHPVNTPAYMNLSPAAPMSTGYVSAVDTVTTPYCSTLTAADDRSDHVRNGAHSPEHADTHTDLLHWRDCSRGSSEEGEPCARDETEQHQPRNGRTGSRCARPECENDHGVGERDSAEDGPDAKLVGEGASGGSARKRASLHDGDGVVYQVGRHTVGLCVRGGEEVGCKQAGWRLAATRLGGSAETESYALT